MSAYQHNWFDPLEQPAKKHLRLLLGGSPCTHWSIAQSKNRETTASGIGWELFKNYLYALEKFKPDYFLYENNKSAAQPIKDQISKELGVPLQYINSALVSAQNRQRFYCHNIPNVPQPEDKGILLKDVLDSGVVDKEKAYCLKHQAGNSRDYFKKHHTQVAFEPTRIPDYGDNTKARPLNALYPNHAGVGEGSLEQRLCSDNPNKQQVDLVAEPIRIGTIEHEGGNDHDSQAYRGYSPEGKAVTQCGQGGGVGAKTGLYACPLIETSNGKSYALTSSYYKASNEPPVSGFGEELRRPRVVESWDGKTHPVYEVKNGLITIKEKQYPIKLPDGYYIIRKLSVAECRRLQTIPDWYQMPCSASQNYKMLGNGWTVEVIKHILSYIPNISDCTVEVLSMYDGMSCAQITLTELGCKIERYVSYEIDKFAIQTTQANFPHTEQRGDAFNLRSPNWAF